MLVDSHNGFNDLIHLEMLRSVRHPWMVGERFVFNGYKHWEQLFLRHPVETPVMLLVWEGVTQGYPSIWYFTVSLSSSWQRRSRQLTQGSSPPFRRMMQCLMHWYG